MRNRISCSAQELSQLDPDMVQSVVGGQVFKIGNQYFVDNRVNILEADNTQVVAEVNGAYGVYSQTIKLKGGSLTTKCSCPSTEQPFCRHCVAVLLHQHNNGSTQSASPQSSSREVPSPPPEPQTNVSPSSGEPASPVEINFREATLFIDWMQQTIGGLGKDSTLPTVPESLRGVAREWTGVISRLNQQFLESEEDRVEAQTSLQASEKKVEELTKELGDVKGESQSFQKSSTELQTKVKGLEDSLAQFGVVSKERDRLVGKVSSMQSELQKKGAELESVSMTLKSLSKAIRNLLPADPS